MLTNRLHPINPNNPITLVYFQGTVFQLLQLHGLLDPSRQDHHPETEQRHQEDIQTFLSGSLTSLRCLCDAKAKSDKQDFAKKLHSE